MTGQISGLSLELVAVVVAASMVAGAVDILRQPGWAWKQAGEPRIAYLILDLLLPLIGLGMYVFRARPKVVAEVAAGAGPEPAPAPPPRPAHSQAQAGPDQAESNQAEPDRGRSEPSPPEKPATVAGTMGTDPFTSFREVTANDYGTDAGTGVDEPSPERPEQFTVSSTFFSTGASSRSLRHPVALARAYRPRQRTSLSDDQPEQTVVAEAEQTVAEAEQPNAIEAEQAAVAVPEPTNVVEAEPPTNVVEAEPPTNVVEAEPPTNVVELQPVPAPVVALEPEPTNVVGGEPEGAGEPQPALSVVEAERERASRPETVQAADREPQQETEQGSVAMFGQPAPSVPSGWKVDPTGRHQFRYWDGFYWTENVADNGEESRDSISA